ncbi:hypothetical protein ACHQM5_005886 [Ranunculus cassubicifolius]
MAKFSLPTFNFLLALLLLILVTEMGTEVKAKSCDIGTGTICRDDPECDRYCKYYYKRSSTGICGLNPIPRQPKFCTCHVPNCDGW